MTAVDVIIIHPKWIDCGYWRRVQKRIDDIAAAKAKAVKS